MAVKIQGIGAQQYISGPISSADFSLLQINHYRFYVKREIEVISQTLPMPPSLAAVFLLADTVSVHCIIKDGRFLIVTINT